MAKPATRDGVSVVIPVYNFDRYLEEAVASVRGQRYPDTEIIVVDDGSEGGTPPAVARLGEDVRVVRRQHGGIGAARNSGVALATGELLAFLDSDDLWTEDSLASRVETLAQHPELDIVFGGVEEFLTPELAGEQQRYRMSQGPQAALLPSAMLVRTASFRGVGQFHEGLALGEFVDWFSRAQELGLRALSIPGVVLRRRIHGSNQGLAAADQRTDYARVLKAALDRRRAASGQ